MDIDDEILMAFADGELPEHQASELRARIAADPALAARVEVFRRTRELFAGLPADPVSDELTARIRAMAPQQQDNVVDLASRRRSVPLWQLPAAAAVALAVGLGAGLLVTGSPEGPIGAQIAAALDTLPSGESLTVDGQTVAAVATFRTPEGELCREYETARDGGATMVNIACHQPQGWDMRFAVASGGGEGYAPVSGLDALDAWLSAAEAGEPLEAEDEQAALSGL